MIERWMESYLKAWASDAPDDIAALFTEDARYYTEPYAEPWIGRDEIVRQWIEHGDSGNEWSFEFETIAETPDAAVIRGVTHYGSESSDAAPKTYHNVWIIRLAPDGRAREFTEWWMKAK